ncbi:MAG: DUF4407 domain-containing protein [Hyphomicrobium sp.]
MRDLSVDPASGNSEAQLYVQRVTAAQTAKDAAAKELVAANIFAQRELGGDCGDAGLSCIAGEGPRYRAAKERMAAAEREVASTSQALESAQDDLRQFRASRSNETQRVAKTADARLGEVSARLASLEAQYATAKAAYERRLGSRERLIHEAAVHDPRHVERRDGLLARLKALQGLARDDAIAAALYGFDALLVLLELAAVMGKTLVLIPMAYATRIVEMDLLRALETTKRLTTAMTEETKSPVAPEAPKKPVVVEPEKRPDSVAVPQPAPAPAPRRHGRRWKPPVSLKDEATQAPDTDTIADANGTFGTQASIA